MIYLRQFIALRKRICSDSCQAFRNIHCCDSCTVLERVTADCCHCVRQSDFLQPRTVIESIIPDACQTFANPYFFQGCASVKYMIAYGCHTVRYHHFFQFCVSSEKICTQFCDRAAVDDGRYYHTLQCSAVSCQSDICSADCRCCEHASVCLGKPAVQFCPADIIKSIYSTGCNKESVLAEIIIPVIVADHILMFFLQITDSPGSRIVCFVSSFKHFVSSVIGKNCKTRNTFSGLIFYSSAQ